MNKLLSSLPFGLRPWLWYGLLTLFILGPLLLPGFILTLDLVFTPHFPPPDLATNAFLLDAALWLLGIVLPADIIEKLVLSAILLLSGAGMHLLVKQLIHSPAGTKEIAAYAGGILYMINPFIYDRIMAGHWRFLIGYALLPFFARSAVLLLRRPEPKAGLAVGILAFAITTASVHHIGLILLLCLGGAIYMTLQKRTALKNASGSIMLAICLWTLLSAPWFVLVFLGSSPLDAAVTSFSQAHFTAFATDGMGLLGKIGNVLRLQGFWVEAQGLFTLPQQYIPLWGILFLLLWGVMGAGVYILYKRSRAFTFVLIALSFAVIVLSTTTFLAWASGILTPLNGYREPQKFVQLLAFIFALLFAFGVSHLLSQTWNRSATHVFSAGLLSLPLLITPTMLGGFTGQLQPRQYPNDWEHVNRLLQASPAPHTSLFLPWHQYAAFGFSKRIIANPAEHYFQTPVIASNDPEFGNISPTFPDSQKEQITQLLAASPTASSLARLGLDYVILAHEQDYKEHQAWLEESAIKLYEGDTLTLYRLNGGGI